jgi:hypothetical protein
MNAVNLLPAKHRPRTPTGGQQGSSYIVIGVLGVVLLMVLTYALTVNGINSKKASVAKTKAESAQAMKRAAELGPYGNFTQVKEQRVSSVKTLATGRIDWERLARGLAHVLPQDVWLIYANASATGDTDGGAPAPATPPVAPAAPAAPAEGGDKPTAAPTPDPEAAADALPRMTIKACAPSHSEIAVTLVRLRHLPNVDEVSLVSATKPQTAQPNPDAADGAPVTGAPAGGGDEDCGMFKKRPAYTFETLVTFKALAGPDAGGSKDKVPTALGGGA